MLLRIYKQWVNVGIDSTKFEWKPWRWRSIIIAERGVLDEASAIVVGY